MVADNFEGSHHTAAEYEAPLRRRLLSQPRPWKLEQSRASPDHESLSAVKQTSVLATNSKRSSEQADTALGRHSLDNFDPD